MLALEDTHTSSALPAEDAHLLALMAQGLKDEVVARRLGLSLRTVRRRIAHLMAELDATTRFQAGIEAVRRGWL